VAAVDLPTWQERLAACFRPRHRLLHVWGVPLAVGGIAAAAASGSLHTRALALGSIVTGIGILLAAWYVVLGGDRRLIAQLQAEKHAARGRSELAAVAASAPLDKRPLLERIRAKLDGLDAELERAAARGGSARLDGLCDDLVSVRHKVLAIATEIPRRPVTEATADAARLESEIARLASELKEAAGALRDALAASRSSAAAELARHRAAIDLDARMTSLLEIIDAELDAVAKVLEAHVAVDDAAGRSLRERLAAALAACDRSLPQATPRGGGGTG
jgi:hypothetical protein